MANSVKTQREKTVGLDKGLVKEAIEAIEHAYYSLDADVSVKATKIKIESNTVTADVTVLYCDTGKGNIVLDGSVYTRARIEEKIAELHGEGVLPKPAPEKRVINIPCDECIRKNLAKDKSDICGIDKHPLTKRHTCPLDSRPRLKKIIIGLIKEYNGVDLAC